MREIKFRGRDKHGELHYGFLWIAQDGTVYIKEFLAGANRLGDFEIVPETVGQYTGLKDSNGTEIYEGDKIRVYEGRYDEDDIKIEREEEGDDFIEPEFTEHTVVYGDEHDYPAFDLYPVFDEETNSLSALACGDDFTFLVVEDE